MITARIYKPSKTAMQSGRGKSNQWVLEYESRGEKRPEPLMGWTGNEDTLGQVRLKFNTLEAAQAYAEKNNMYPNIQPESVRKPKARNYGDNFKYIPHEESK